LPNLGLAKYGWKPNRHKVWQKLAKNPLYDKWAIWIVKCGSSKVGQEPNTCQIAKFWLGKVWLVTKHALILALKR
jgi:hypothetical protein